MTTLCGKAPTALAVGTLALAATLAAAPAHARRLAAPTGADARTVDFDRDVRPILERSCFECHSDKKAKGGLDLSTSEAIRQGGVSGDLMIPGKSGMSYLLSRVLGQGDEERMPTDGKFLTEAETELLRRWIDEGAHLPTPPIPEFKPAPAGMRRLTAEQFRNTLQAWLGQEVVSELDEDGSENGFTSMASYRITTSLRGIELYREAAFKIARRIFEDSAHRARVVGCSASRADDPCARRFIDRWAGRLWRRPAKPSETALYRKLAVLAARHHNDVDAGLETAFSALLQSPSFLYATERGTGPEKSQARPLDGWEIATRLALFLTDAGPDEALLAAAADGTLTTAPGVRAQAERIMASPAAAEGVRAFAAQYLKLDELMGLARDPVLYPNDSHALRLSMGEEIKHVFQNLVLGPSSDGANAMDLFSSRKTYVNASLAKLYGLKGDFPADAFVPAELPADGPRAGLLGFGGFLSIGAIATRPSPTLRGVFIRERLLCQEVPPPPDNVSTELPPERPGALMTMRTKLNEHSVNPGCANCHKFFDPLGLALERFDSLGAFRTTDRGLPLDTTGELDGKPYKNARDLGALIGADPRAAACLVKNVYQHATGRAAQNEQTRVLGELTDAFTASGHNLRSLMIAITTSDGFRFVSAPEERKIDRRYDRKLKKMVPVPVAENKVGRKINLNTTLAANR